MGKRNIGYSLRQRADTILLSADGCEVKLIVHRAGLDQSNVIKWIKRFNEDEIDALGDIRNR
jgi:transposase